MNHSYAAVRVPTYTTQAEPLELFPASVEEVFNRLEVIGLDDSLYEEGEDRPSADNIEWAKRVLLRIMPRKYLVGAEIDPFQSEIHVTWTKAEKKVIAFFVAPNVLKLYYELQTEGREPVHNIRSATQPQEISGFLGWLNK